MKCEERKTVHNEIVKRVIIELQMEIRSGNDRMSNILPKIKLPHSFELLDDSEKQQLKNWIKGWSRKHIERLYEDPEKLYDPWFKQEALKQVLVEKAWVLLR